MPKSAQKRVLVGMSGGVDSSVTAALLQQRGFEVVGGFIKNWSDTADVWTGECAWRGERRDALRVAAKLGIPLLTFDFEKEYRARVVKNLFAGYAAGETPNPDVLCNEAIKFGLFFETAKKLGFALIATGHYARVKSDKDGRAQLLRGVDPDKDQSYFLYRVAQAALARTLFPVGELKKSAVRKLARKFNLPVADKPDSQGVCFIGKLDMGEFLRKKIPARPGDIVDPKGEIIGRHAGLDQYTIGQRQGIGLGRTRHNATALGGWYVADKDIKKNRLIVVPSDKHPLLFRSEFFVHDARWIKGAAPQMPARATVQIRYRQPAEKAVIDRAGKNIRVRLNKPIRAVAPGQSAVFYQKDICLGGGEIC